MRRFGLDMEHLNGRSGRLLALFLAVSMVFLVVSASSAMADPATPAPTISSDKDDYAPGEVVTLIGSNWQPGEVVHITINDDQGKTWTRDVDVTADAGGSITYQFQLPDWFVALYSVQATGSLSGTAGTSFTDGTVAIRNATTTPAGLTAQYRLERFDGASCTGTVKASNDFAFPGSGSKAIASGGSESVRVSFLSATSGYAFDKWHFADGNSGGDGAFHSTAASFCFATQNNTNRNFIAHFKQSNATPAVVANDGSVGVNEGQTSVNSGTWSDANAGDTVTLSASVGTIVKSGTNASGTWAWSYSTSDGPDQSQTVTIGASDGTATSTTTFDLTVSNAKPTVTLSGPATADEGDTKTYSYTVTDPGQDTYTTSISCGTDGDLVAGSDDGDSFECAFPDGPATSTVSFTATDSDGASDTDNRQVEVIVANLAPSVTLTGAASATEGSTHTYSYSATDPGDDSPLDWTISCGAEGDLVAGSDDGDSFDCSFPDGPATPSVSASAFDGTDTGSDSISMTVSNAKPTVTLSGPATADEGDTKTYSYTVTDPGQDTYTTSISCGTDGDLVAGSDDGDSFECAFPDGPATSTVSFTATDSDGASDTDNRQVEVIVANLAPSVTLTGAASATEGSTHTYSYSATDPGDDSPLDWTISCGAEGDLVAGSDDGDSFDCSFPDGPATPSVSASAFDGTDTGSDSISMTVSNAKPTVTLSGPATADEGDTKTYSYTVTDPGQDTYTTSISCGTDGDLVAGSDDGDSFECAFPDGPATSTVSFTATDSDGASDTDNRQVEVIVANLAPSVTLTGAASATEGSTHTYSYSATDPGDDSPLDWTISCGAEGDLVAGSDDGDSFDCSFPDGPATPSVSASAFDGTDTGSDSISMTVSNAKPTVTLSGPATADEGDTKTYSYTVTDPGQDTYTTSISCGTDGDLVAGSDDGDSFECAFPDGPTTSTVSFTATDSDGASDTDNRQVEVIVANLAPSVTLTGAASATEGSTHTYSYSATDPGDDSPLDWTISCGAEGDLVAGSDDGDSFDCSFPDGPATPSVSASAFDGTDTGSDSISMTVSNAKPTIGNFLISGSEAVACATNVVSVTFTVSDPAAESHDAIAGSIYWGDGSSTLISGRTVTETHTYSPGSYALTATIDDGDGGSDSAGGIGNVSLLYTTSGFMQPINMDGSSNFKIGSTIPVKLKMFDCLGNQVTTLSPTVHLKKIGSGAGTVNEVISSSAADSGNTMRHTGDSYMFNLSTKRSQFNAGQDLTQGRYELTVKHSTIADVVVQFDLRK